MCKTKKIKLFGAIHKSNPAVFLTITSSKEEALEYVNTVVKMNHLFHYKLWCNMRNLSINDGGAWVQYFIDCIPEEEKLSYNIVSFYYDNRAVASLARMFGGCIPLGSSFDEEPEYTLLKSKIESNNLSPAIVKMLELNKDINPRQIEIVWEDIEKKGENKDVSK